MEYDIIEFGGSISDGESLEFFTIGDLIEVCENYPQLPVIFLGTSRTVGNLVSWRGSYDLPSIEPIPAHPSRKGGEIADTLRQQLTETHYGWKGGEYQYDEGDEFYVASAGSSAEYKVVKAVVENGTLVLYTKLDPY